MMKMRRNSKPLLLLVAKEPPNQVLIWDRTAMVTKSLPLQASNTGPVLLKENYGLPPKTKPQAIKFDNPLHQQVEISTNLSNITGEV
jgi:hypothetical protein